MNTSISTLCRQYFGNISAGDTVYVTCLPSTMTFRYVIIQSNLSNYSLCLTDIQVYVGWYIIHLYFVAMDNYN